MPFSITQPSIKLPVLLESSSSKRVIKAVAKTEWQMHVSFSSGSGQQFSINKRTSGLVVKLVVAISQFRLAPGSIPG